MERNGQDHNDPENTETQSQTIRNQQIEEDMATIEDIRGEDYTQHYWV